MVIIKLSGGIGNQMFQFALYRAFEAKGINAKIDRSKYSHFIEKRMCLLDYPCFNLEYNLCTKKEARAYVIGTGMTARLFVKMFGDKRTHYYEKSDYEYDEEILNISEGYLEGYWQTREYMATCNIQEKVKKDFAFVGDMPETAGKYMEEIDKTNSVAVHIRRGDYLKAPQIYGNICTLDYYMRAIEKINSLVENPQFFFFSDDMDWVKQNFESKGNYVFVDGRGKWSDYCDMRLMSSCKSHIMANSSFSWWAAFLNPHEDKRIICPSRWVNGKDAQGVYCEGWIRG